MQYRIFKDFHDKTFKFELNNELLKIDMTMLSSGYSQGKSILK